MRSCDVGQSSQCGAGMRCEASGEGSTAERAVERGGRAHAVRTPCAGIRDEIEGAIQKTFSPQDVSRRAENGLHRRVRHFELTVQSEAPYKVPTRRRDEPDSSC